MKTGEKVGIGIIVVLLSFFLGLTAYMESQRVTPTADSTTDGTARASMGFFPQGFTVETLPEPESRGAKALGLYCVQCHALPIPSMHTQQEWEVILARMRGHMEAQSGGMIVRIMQLSDKEEDVLAAYLTAHAIRSIEMAALPDVESPAAQSYVRYCSSCHATPDPAQHTGTQWSRVLLRMKGYMEAAGKEVPADSDFTLLREYLTRVGAQ